MPLWEDLMKRKLELLGQIRSIESESKSYEDAIAKNKIRKEEKEKEVAEVAAALATAEHFVEKK